MIVGECPYECGGGHCVPLSQPISFTKHECETCGKTFWIKHSRIEPEAYTDEDFNKDFYIDDNGRVKEK